MSRLEVFLWVALPYLAIAVFVAGHVWRFRRDQLAWTARSTQLLESRLLRVGSLLFHFGILAVLGGHVLGILIPPGLTSAVGISDHSYHLIALTAGGTSGVAMTIGFLILLYRRAAVPRVRVTTSRSDLVMYPVLAVALLTGIAAVLANLLDEYNYRETVSPWFRGIFTLDPDGELMTEAPFLFQLHAASLWLLYLVWPFSRLVHVWSVPLTYLRRKWIPYRSRNPRAALAAQRGRREGTDTLLAGEPR